MSEASRRLANMWSAEEKEGGPKTISEFRASSMNLIVHIGFEASASEALELFRSVVSFSHRYPCRLIFVCPQPDSWDVEANVSCKIFSECVIGSKAQTNCCEALIICYSLNNRPFLENQVSVFLESDLPTYYWPTRFGSAALLSDYTFFFGLSKRIVFDSSRECFTADQVKFDDRSKVHDLSFKRLLSVRQCIGQFLSSYPTSTIIDGLKRVTLCCGEEIHCEGRALLCWVSEALFQCFGSEEKALAQVRFSQEDAAGCASKLRMSFEYENQRYLKFDLDLAEHEGHVEADLGHGKQTLTTGVRLLDLESALSEALFHS